MARYDKDTEDFIDHTVGEQVARQALGVVKDVAKGRHVAESVVRRAIGAGAAVMTKEGQSTPRALFSLLNEQHGEDWWDWEPETLRAEIDLDDIEIVQALQVLCRTNYPFEEWHVFENVVHALTGNVVHFGSLQPVEMDEAACAIKLMREIRPKQEFDDEVCGYLAACAKHAGIVYLPSDLFPARCQHFLDGLNNDMELKAVVQSGKHTNDQESALAIQQAKLIEIRERVDG
jgi:hypothetical protein